MASEARVIRFANDRQFVTAIAGTPGRIYTPMVWIDAPVRLARIPNGDVTLYGQEIAYPLKKAALTMLRAGRSLGIHKPAKRFLQECRK